MARVSLVPAQDVPDEHRAFVDGLNAQGGYINLYRAMAHSPVALRRLYELLACLYGGVLTPRLREIAILTVVASSHAPYPLGWHLLDGEDAGLTPSEIRAIVTGDALPSPIDLAVAGFARELTVDARVSDATFRAVGEHLDERQIVELTMLAGLYRLVACTSNALEVEPDGEPAAALERLAAWR